MIQGICLKCGRKYYGWALKYHQHQMCDNCGSPLKVFSDSKEMVKAKFIPENWYLQIPTENICQHTNGNGISQG